MPGITLPVVHEVSALPEAAQASYVNTGISYDYAIGGLPFLSAASQTFPLRRQTAEYTKQQIDQSTEPGEQTLVAWWLRSQSSFHDGTGITFEEPTTADPTIQYRFQDSAGVNVWTPGHVTLLPSAPQDVSSTGTPLAMGVVSGGTDYYFLADGASLKRCPGNGTSTAVTWGGTGTILAMTSDGTNYYVADSVGIWKGPLDLSTNGTKIWNTGSSAVALGWVKQRLMAGIGPSVYELVGTGPALPTPTYTNPNSAWAYTAITESPAAIYAAGYAGANSAAFMFTLDTTGVVPTLTSGIVALQLPEGEIAWSMYGYLGTYVAIGTNKGCRIADVQNDGSLQYGPLSVTLPAGAGPVKTLIGGDRFIYGGFSNAINSASGLFRLDLGTSLGYKLFAYASDLQSHVTGDVLSVTLLGSSGKLLFTVAGHGSYLQSANLETTGYLTTGNIRYHILEPKLFKYVRVWAKPLTKGSVQVASGDHAGNYTTLVTFTAGHVDDPLDEVAFPTSYGPQEYVSLKITLGRDSVDATSGPTVTAYQVKALPAQRRQRTFVLPLSCFDMESDRNSKSAGQGEGSALARLRALEALEEAGDVVRLDDLTPSGGPPRQVIIDSLEFVQQITPKAGLKGAGWGGVILATLRAVT